jgi:endoglucanase
VSSIVRKVGLVVSVLVLVPLTQPAPGSAAARAYVRVNQVGYVQDGPKQAFLLSTQDHGGEPFDLVGDGGVVAFSGTVGANRGAWNDRYGHVNQIDFDAFADPGVYVLKAAGATSPPFEIGSGSAVFDHLLSNALAFFQEQHDGRHVAPGLLDRKPSHLNDAHATAYETPVYVNGHLSQPLVPTGTVDVEGGWFDAGDYIKFVHTAAFVEVPMQLALRDDASLFTNGGPNFRAEAKFGLRWLLKMIDVDRGVVYYQVGIGNGGLGYNSDHDVWRLPEVDDAMKGRANTYLTHRPVFRVGPPGTPIPPSIAGRMAAAFGLCSQIFAGTDQAFADRCLRAGEAAFALADTSHTTNHTTAPSGYYPEGQMWRDDMELGAVELHLALRGSTTLPTGLPVTDPATYLADAAHWARAYLKQSAEQHDTFNLYDVSGLAHVELIRALHAAGDPTDLPVSSDDLLAGLAAQLDHAAAAAAADPFAFGSGHGDPAPHAFGLSAEAAWYDQVTGTSRYADLQASELSWAPGANAWGSTFVIGAGSVFPHCPQDQPANIVGSLDGTGNIMLGGGVDGPSGYIPTGFFGPASAPPCPPDGANPFRPFDQTDWRYVDRVASWATVEPADDYSILPFIAFVQYASTG